MTTPSTPNRMGYLPAVALLVAAAVFVVVGLVASSLVPIIIAAALGAGGVIQLAGPPRERVSDDPAASLQPHERRHPDARTSVTSGDEHRSGSAGGGFFF